MEKKIEALFGNQEFVEKLAAMETIDDMAEALQAEGVEITANELEAALVRAQKVQDGEMSEDDLDNVSGGIITPLLIAAGSAAFGYGLSHVISALIRKARKSR